MDKQKTDYATILSAITAQYKQENDAAAAKTAQALQKLLSTFHQPGNTVTLVVKQGR